MCPHQKKKKIVVTVKRALNKQRQNQILSGHAPAWLHHVFVYGDCVLFILADDAINLRKSSVLSFFYFYRELIVRNRIESRIGKRQ